MVLFFGFNFEEHVSISEGEWFAYIIRHWHLEYIDQLSTLKLTLHNSHAEIPFAMSLTSRYNYFVVSHL